MSRLDLSDPSFQSVSHLRPLKGDTVKGVILVDMSWILHRSFYANSGLSCMVGDVEVRTGDIYGALKTISALVRRRPTSVVFLVLDGSIEFRRKLYPKYKAGREDTHKSDIYLKMKEIIEAACLYPNVYAAIDPNMEADDTICSMARKFSGCVKEVLIHTSDQDVYQVVSEKIKVIKKLIGNGFKLVDREGVKEKMGVYPEQVLLFRCLVGDKSDNIDGYIRVPRKFAQFFAEHFETPESFLSMSEEAFNAFLKAAGISKSHINWCKKIRKDPDILKRNYVLMGYQDVGRPQMCRLPGSFGPLRKYALRQIENLVKTHLFEMSQPEKSGDDSTPA